MSTLISEIVRFRFNRRIIQALCYSSQLQESKNKIGNVVNVAIIGAPNSGKSTLINNIVERKVCAASNKVHTTTKLIRALYYQNSTQIIFLDTPGVVNDREQRKYKLPNSMIGACHKSLRCADVVGVVHDVGNRWTKDSLHSDVVEMLKTVENVPSFLILNKVDKLKSKKQLLSIIRNLTNSAIAGSPIPGFKSDSRKKELEADSSKKLVRGWSKFSDVFLVSALNGDGVQAVKDYLLNNAKPASLHYSPEDWTDQTPESLVEESVRAKFLDFLSHELPYNLDINLEYFEEIEEEDKIMCSVAIQCPTERLLRLIGGAGGGRLQQIRTHVRNDLVELFKKTVVVDLHLKVKSKPDI